MEFFFACDMKEIKQGLSLRQERRETHGKKGTGQHRHVHRKTGCPEHGALRRVYGADAGLRYMVYYNGCEGDTIR